MLGTDQIKQTITANTAELVRLHKAVHEEAEYARSHGIERSADGPLQVWREFQVRYDSLAFPGGWTGALQRISLGDEESLEAAICFLELRPYFFRSGYMFKDILRKCRKAPLSSDQHARLMIVEQKLREWSLRCGPLSRQHKLEEAARLRGRHETKRATNTE